MIDVILKSIISYLTPIVFGFLIGNFKSLKTFKDEFKNLKETQLLDMKSDLSNKFYVYDAMPEVEDYLIMSFQEKCERYFAMGGDTWIHPMFEKSKNWKIKPTGYLR